MNAGSCPAPPPLTMATRPAVPAVDVRTRGLSVGATSSPAAAQKPAIMSSTTLVGSLTNRCTLAATCPKLVQRFELRHLASRAATGELRAEPAVDQLDRQPRPDHACTEAQDLCVVRFPCAGGRVHVRDRGGAHAADLVGGDRHPD